MQIFRWDPEKARTNVRKHHISFQSAKGIWDGPTTTEVDNREEYGEVRFVTMGMLPNSTTVLHVTHTYENNVIRIISARPATRREREAYFANKGFNPSTR